MFSDPRYYLWLIPALPLLAAAVIGVLGKAILRDRSHWLCIGGAIGACILSFMTLSAVSGLEGDRIDGHRCIRIYYTWFHAGNVDIPFSLQADGLTAVMLVTVTFIGSLIAIYSVGYMHGDPGFPRFFAAVSLFLASMTLLVLANNFIVLFAAWEGVGLCSYLLVGFWYAKPSAADAARKAFLVTRLGDVGLFLGILLIWVNFGYSLEYDVVFERARSFDNHGLLVVICLLLFSGAVGKSAQFPLHVWLPDAMEGPSPVSALIHAATMVTAGVYLVARCTPLFGQAPEAQLVVACIAAGTALLAALIALTQSDLKRVLAYSTISQLGYMFLALGSGTMDHRLAAVAVTAAIFHLFTHAFFKALLFLGAGSVMHAMGGIIDMRRFSGLRRLLPVTHWTFLCGAGALAGIPLLSGFWSKDEILAVTKQAGQPGSFASGIYLLLFFIGVATAGLTGFYTFRAYFLTFWGEEKVPHEAGHHAHESPPVMTLPLCVLAVGAVGAGLVFGPTGWFGGFLEEHWVNPEFPRRLLSDRAEHAHDYLVMLFSSIVALTGVGAAYWMYVRQPALADSLARAWTGLYELSRNKFYLDDFFYSMIVKPLTVLALLARVVDQYIVDGLVDLVGQVPAFIGYAVRPVQNGLVQFYALLMALGVGGFFLAILLR
ncbi:MAG: NADH-quinone oxidoreductase subunit L [Planctomycetes bacterium]|nr:NADH-quinone oxidoreductase subunit L [Planctomycetota bacterium]